MNKTLIETIEDSYLNAHDKYNLLLVANGLRTGAWMKLVSPKWREGDAPQSVSQAALDHTIDLLKTAKLSYEINRRITDTGVFQNSKSRRRWWEVADIFVATNTATLQKLVKAVAQQDDSAIGQAFGYPATAVEAFGTDRRMPVRKLPLKVQLSEVAQFVEIILSADHWQAELNQLEAWSKRVLELSPAIYYGYRHDTERIDAELATELLQVLPSKE